jgi:hypothetical protein
MCVIAARATSTTPFSANILRQHGLSLGILGCKGLAFALLLAACVLSLYPERDPDSGKDRPPRRDARVGAPVCGTASTGINGLLWTVLALVIVTFILHQFDHGRRLCLTTIEWSKSA